MSGLIALEPPGHSRTARPVLRLFVFPVVLGSGERLFGETSDKKPMRLVDTKTVGDGLVFVTYQLVPQA